MASTSTPKPDEKSSTPADSKPEQSQNNKTAGALEEDDEFEDFPVEDWPAEETESANQQGNSANGGTAADHLWEESWDDDDTSDDFSAQLREELKKVDAAKRR
ncbi:DSS1/SEM1 family-domain-containing protein [Apiospora arundinis]|uniref:26S proteasome complex subunit SEM1 n=1 Tax=Apiospora arundinis TaxID=335852 RepID=A0ABR2I9D0_9PEZI